MKNVNEVNVIGTVETIPTLSHETNGELFYKFTIAVERKSGTVDRIEVVASKMLTLGVVKGSRVHINGSYRSFNKQNEGAKSNLLLFIFADEIEVTTAEEDVNEVVFKGFICKEVKYRETPQGRQIADVFIAMNRNTGKTDYIPCIAWGRNALAVSKLAVGTPIAVNGRIQSRNYNKVMEDNSVVEKTAYEVSIYKIDVVDKED